MNKITAFKTSDGKVFEDEIEAGVHEATLKRRKAVEALVEEHCYRDMGKSAIVDMMLENEAALKNAMGW